MKKAAVAAVIAVLMALAMVVAGCGEDSETTEALTRVQFVKEGNAICKESNKEREAIFQSKSGSAALDTPGKEELVTEAFVSPYGEMIDNLKELGTPEGDEEKVEAIIEEMEKGLQVLEDAPLKGLASTKMFKEANELSSDYGLTDCVV